jgi:hypothetical protein
MRLKRVPVASQTGEAKTRVSRGKRPVGFEFGFEFRLDLNAERAIQIGFPVDRFD